MVCLLYASLPARLNDCMTICSLHTCCLSVSLFVCPSVFAVCLSAVCFSTCLCLTVSLPDWMTAWQSDRPLYIPACQPVSLSRDRLYHLSACLPACMLATLPLPGSGNTKGGSITVQLTSWLTGLESAVMTTYNFCFYLQSRLIQTSQTGGHP